MTPGVTEHGAGTPQPGDSALLDPTAPRVGRRAPRRFRLTSFDPPAALLISLVVFFFYVLTLAPTVLRADSGEFHVVPWVLGIAHPPGYPLLTLLGRLAMFLPFGDPAYRVNLLDAAAAAAAAGLVYMAVVELGEKGVPWTARLGGLAGALALGLGATYWQQSVVGGPRPFTFLFTALLLWLLLLWGRRGRPKDLAMLAGAAGLAMAHHPNQALLFPGLALYVLGRDPRLLFRFKQLVPVLLAFALPLLLYLYLPLRSAMDPPLGDDTLADPRSLAIYLTAGNYQNTILDNCGGSRLVQIQRYLEFLGLQFGAALPFAIALGAAATLLRSPLAGVTLLYAFASNAIFGICSSLAMPDYVIPSYVVAAIWLGLALIEALNWLSRLSIAGLARGGESDQAKPGGAELIRTVPAGLAAGLILGLSAYRVATGLPYQSMAGRTADADRARSGLAQAVSPGLLLSDWETITPIWYAQQVLGLSPRTNTAIVTAPPGSEAWTVATQKGLEDGRVTLAARVPAVSDKYRLFPIGSLFEVTPRPVVERAPNVGLLGDDRVSGLLSFKLDRPSAAPGELLHLTLYQRAGRGVAASFLPVVRLVSEPPVEFRFGSALHYRLQELADHEVIGDVYEFSLPTWLPPGDLPLELAYQVEGRDKLVGPPFSQPWTGLGSLSVVPAVGPAVAPTPGAVANFANQLILRGGRVSANGVVAELPSGITSFRLKPSSTLELEARWSALRWIDESYTLFAHLLDSRSQLVAQQDSLPLGGVYHTYKWVPGQTITDWYRLPLPPSLPPGDYWLEIGAYESTTTRRLAVLDSHGGARQTSFLWGPFRLE